ncbi:MAG: phosphoglucosamine mutase [Bacteroidia bacterium]|nr:phosphoglucosamine mutase [Bacteroidia bacterium]
MTLIKSISGIRGTIGDKAGEGLSPLDIVKFTAAYSMWVKQNYKITKGKIVVGRDARISGEMVYHVVSGTLVSMGFDVINIGMATTPTTEIAVTEEKADGGIILTASHNPKQWNALKLLNRDGEFLNDADGKKVLSIAEHDDLIFSDVDAIGKIFNKPGFEDIHIKKILGLALVDMNAIKNAGFKVTIDCVNSVGGIVIPKLLKALGVNETVELYCEANGQFPHNPEPLPEHLKDISELTEKQKAHVGFVVDPDVDRLAIICEDGTMFGEEYTLVSVADYVLQNKKGNTVSNMSSSRALRDITRQHKGIYEASAVGEVNVVAKMKEIHAVIGGEGNGGVIYPELHYGRDALVGIALFLTQLAKSGKKCSELRAGYPTYVMSKNKIQLTPDIQIDTIFNRIKKEYGKYPVSTIDGVKIDFEDGWVHLRKSNTEPVIRIYSEGKTDEIAEKLATDILEKIKKISSAK